MATARLQISLRFQGSSRTASDQQAAIIAGQIVYIVQHCLCKMTHWIAANLDVQMGTPPRDQKRLDQEGLGCKLDSLAASDRGGSGQLIQIHPLV